MLEHLVLLAKHLDNPQFTSVLAGESITLELQLKPTNFTQQELNTNRRRREDILFVISKLFIAQRRRAFLA